MMKGWLVALRLLVDFRGPYGSLDEALDDLEALGLDPDDREALRLAWGGAL